MVVTELLGAASITRGVEWRDNLNQVPREDWPELLGEYQEFCQRVLPRNCRELLRLISSGADVEWAGFGSREAYIRDGLGLEPRAAEWAARGLQLLGNDERPVSFQKAQAVALAQEGGTAAAAPVINAGPGRGKKTADNIRGFSEGSTSAVRIVARLKRDHPDVAAQLAAGEFRSAAAAGRAAGIVKPLPTALERLRAAWERCSPKERETFRRWIR
jgi:hypothetical protein